MLFRTDVGVPCMFLDACMVVCESIALCGSQTGVERPVHSSRSVILCCMCNSIMPRGSVDASCHSRRFRRIHADSQSFDGRRRRQRSERRSRPGVCHRCRCRTEVYSYLYPAHRCNFQFLTPARHRPTPSLQPHLIASGRVGVGPCAITSYYVMLYPNISYQAMVYVISPPAAAIAMLAVGASSADMS